MAQASGRARQPRWSHVGAAGPNGHAIALPAPPSPRLLWPPRVPASTVDRLMLLTSLLMRAPVYDSCVDKQVTVRAQRKSCRRQTQT